MAKKRAKLKKQCRKCKKWKDKSEFHNEKRRKDGLHLHCKDCVCEYARKHYRKIVGPSRRTRRYEDRRRVVDGVRKKRCCTCDKWKDESHYYKHVRHIDGFTDRCKECTNKATNKCRSRRIAVVVGVKEQKVSA